jgi:hypothetical protein
VFTHLEDLKNFPERIGVLRNSAMSHGGWEEAREKEREFVDEDGGRRVPGSRGAGYRRRAQWIEFGRAVEVCG